MIVLDSIGDICGSQEAGWGGLGIMLNMRYTYV